MLAFIIILLAFVAGYGLLQLGQIDPDNYVKVYLSNYVVEVSVVQFLVLLAIIIIAVYIAIRLVMLVLRSSSIWSKWRNKKNSCLLYTSPSPRDQRGYRMPSSA